MARPLPNVLGCAIGFCAIGSGVGAYTGCYVAGQLWRAIPEVERAGLPMTGFLYTCLLRGMFVGMALGAAAGVAYALLVRRARVRS